MTKPELQLLDRAVQQELITGRREAVGWGASLHSPIHLAAAPYRFVAIVDIHAGRGAPSEVCGVPVLSPDYLRTCDPGKTAIVALSGRVNATVIHEYCADFGLFPVTAPLLPARDLPHFSDSTEDGSITADKWSALLASCLTSSRKAKRVPVQRIVLWLWRLGYGGAERQMVVLALALRQLGLAVTLISAHPDPEECSPWAVKMADAGVERVTLVETRKLWPMLSDTRSRLHQYAALLAPQLKPDAAIEAAQTACLIDDRAADLVVCYGDYANIIGGAAAALAGVPRIILSGRSVNPTAFPQWYPFLPAEIDRLPRIYRALLERPGLRLTGNSHSGALSYATWLGLPTEAVPVIPNAVIPGPPSPPPLDARSVLGLPRHGRIILGILRLSAEKAPLTWISVVARVLSAIPDATAVILGDGVMRGQVEESIASLGLTGRIILRGQVHNTSTYLAASDVLLLTSLIEGTPNVILEAQVEAIPVVATDVGGVRGGTASTLQSYLCEPDDVDGLVDRCLMALTYGRQAALAAAVQAREIVLARHAPSALAHATLRLVP
jgi:glycosyltransferase involved in cell wall biosynthesis